MVSRNPEDRDTLLSRESTKSSSETEEDQSAMIPTLNATDLFKNRSMPSKKELHDWHTYLNCYLFYSKNTTIFELASFSKNIQNI